MLALTLTADLSGYGARRLGHESMLITISVTGLIPTDTPDAPYYYTFKVQCTSCRETHANWVGVSRHVGISRWQLNGISVDEHSTRSASGTDAKVVRK